MNETEKYLSPVGIADAQSEEILIPDVEVESPYELVTRRTNFINLSFASFLIAIRLGDRPRQTEEFNNLRWLLGKAGKYQDDWESIVDFCIAKEVKKHSDLNIPGVLARANQNGFSYLWLAGKRDFANARQAHWRRHNNERARGEDFRYKQDLVATKQTVLDLEQIAKGLPEPIAVIVQCMADIYRNPSGLQAIAEKSDTQIRMNLVREAAERLGLDLRQVKRYLAKLQHPDSPQYAAPKEVATDAALEAHYRQHYPAPPPVPTTTEVKKEISKRLETKLQPYSFYKKLDSKTSAIVHGIPIAGKRREDVWEND